MKIKNFALATVLFTSVAVFAQKDEVKSADKAFKAGNAAEAKATLERVEYMVVNADPVTKAQYYFILGNANLDLAKKKIDESKNLVAAAKAFTTLVEVEEETGKPKFTPQAQASIKEVKDILTNSAIEDSNAKRYKEGALKLYEVYNLDKTQPMMLYYAASTAVNGLDYDLALDYYKKLKAINFSGEGTNYIAKSKLTDKDETFVSQADRDNAVKIGTHTDPKTEKLESKRGEIYKNISLIYISKNDIPSAKKAIAEARLANPNDVSLIMSEADLYLKTNDHTMYKNLISEVLAKDPNNADLYYNLGVITSQSKEKNAKIDAEGYYLKAIQIDPKYKNAYINLTILKLDGEQDLLNEMGKLGTSAADNKKYEVLKTKHQNMFKSAIPYLEKAYELMPTDKDIKSTLLNMYNALDMTEKAKALKAKN